jgi:hypothetical protein
MANGTGISRIIRAEEARSLSSRKPTRLHFVVANAETPQGKRACGHVVSRSPVCTWCVHGEWGALETEVVVF